MARQTPESKFKDQVRKALRAQGAFVAKTHGSRFSRDMPDMFVSAPGMALWMELKWGKNWLTPKQESIGRAVLASGFPFFVLRGYELGGRRMGAAIGVHMRILAEMDGIPDLAFLRRVFSENFDLARATDVPLEWRP